MTYDLNFGISTELVAAMKRVNYRGRENYSKAVAVIFVRSKAGLYSKTGRE